MPQSEQGNEERFSKLAVAFKRVQWFIPPYVSVKHLVRLQELIDSEPSFDEDALEAILEDLYSVDYLAALVAVRYPEVSYVSESLPGIKDAVEAHFWGLDHLACAVLLDVLEQITRRLCLARGSPFTNLRGALSSFAKEGEDAIAKSDGADSREALAMFRAFGSFVVDWPFDWPARWRSVDFLRALSVIEFLAFAIGFREPVSAFAAAATADTRRLAIYYASCMRVASTRPLPQ
jgi:hypothetical protein